MLRTSNLPKWKKTAAVLSAVALLTSVSWPWYGSNSYAAGPGMDQIRVALFLDGKLGNGIPVVTLSSAQGLDVGIRTPSSVQNWFSVNPGASAKFSLDKYAVLVLETEDWAEARAAADKLPAEGGQQAVIWNRSISGKTVYQVYFGTYNDLDTATTMRDKLTSSAQFSPLAKAGGMRLVGPYRWSAGTFAAEADALKLQTDAAQAGLTADVVLQADAAGKPSYSVWIGSEPTQTALSSLKDKAAAAMPGITLQPAPTDAAYLLRRSDATASSTAAAAHYVFGGDGTRVWVQPQQPGIVVKERFGRSYRGSIELSEQGDSLAVINEVPFEQYLDSVVSSEMGTRWPAEALKAQAVAARTYALKQGMKYGIANVSDSTVDQAYKGMSVEAADVSAAVSATQGEVLTDANGLITPLYSSNAGGITSDSTEIWGNSVSYLKSVQSPDDGAAAGKLPWYRVALANGIIGYARSDYLKDTGGKNAAGFPVYSSIEDGLNVRPAPSPDAANTPIAQLNEGDRVSVIGTVPESTAYEWMKAPVDSGTLQSKLSASGFKESPKSLQVTQRGPSGRVTEVTANGQPLKVRYPDMLRSVLGGLPSTLFEIEETGRYTIVGASGTHRELPEAEGSLYAISAGTTTPAPVAAKQMVALGAGGEVRVLTKTPEYVFTGKGYGHGLGMSQWGARGYAELGYDYKKILQTYYSGVSIVKDGS